MANKTIVKSKSFMSIYKPRFDEKKDMWVLQVPQSAVAKKSDNFYEVCLPVYAGRVLAIGGNILRTKRVKYRAWLLAQQHGLCTICGKGTMSGERWNLDHQPPLANPSSKFIDYGRLTQNRVIHRSCDSAQMSKKKA